MSARCVIAHVSDIHIGNHDKDILNRLKASLLQDPLPDFLVVTGDLSERSRKWQLHESIQFLQEVRQEIQGRGHPVRSLVIPGNHDVGDFKWQRQWRKAFSSSWGAGAVQGVCMPSTVHAPDERYCECYPNAQLVFLKFDSNDLFGWPWRYANGYVGAKQCNKVEQALQRHLEANPRFQEYRKIALVHHHVHYLPMSESDKLFLMKDAGLFWRKMIEWGVELILHGHKHYATHAILRYLQPVGGATRQERELMILSAGTATSKDVKPNQRNSYYKIECDAFKYTVRHFAYGDVGFELVEPPIEYRSIPRFRIDGTKGAIDMAALESMLVPEAADRDPRHYQSVRYEALIGRDLSYELAITFEGLYAAVAPYLEVPLVVVGAPDRLPHMRREAFDCVNNRPLTEPEISRHDHNVDKLKLRISLPALALGQRFCVRLKVWIPRLMYRENDFDAVGLARFTGGLDEFRYVLRSQLQPVEPRCFTMHRDGPHELGGTTVVEERDAEGNRLYAIHPPNVSVAELGLGLICHYRRLAEPPA